MGKKHIAIVVKNLTSGGAEKQSVLAATVLADVYEVHYVILNAAKIHVKYLTMLESEPKICIHAFKGNMASRFRQFCSCLKEQKIDVILSYLTMANLLATLAGRLAGVGSIYIGLRNAFLPWPKMVADRFLCNCLATGAVSNSYSGKRHFVQQHFKEDKITVIPNCYDHISAYEKKPDKRRLTIITVGRFVKQKDYETAMKAVTEVKRTHDARFVIVGYGEQESDVRRWVNEYGIADMTEIKINPDNIAQLEREADIYLSTSLFEGTSNSIMEGMDANLPIVCTRVGDNDELVSEGVNGFLCNVGDYTDMAAKICRLIKDENMRNCFGRSSKKILEEKFGTDIFKKRYMALIESL